jgi:hypothetical protein
LIKTEDLQHFPDICIVKMDQPFKLWTSEENIDQNEAYHKFKCQQKHATCQIFGKCQLGKEQVHRHQIQILPGEDFPRKKKEQTAQ